MMRNRYAGKARCIGLVAATLLAMASCSSARDVAETESTTSSGLAVSDAMGFETLAAWTPTSGAASLSTNHTQGLFAYSLVPNGWLQLTSEALSTLAGVTSTLALDFSMPQAPPNPYWLGTLQVGLTIPSLGASWQSGTIDLSTLARGAYSSVHYALPANVVSALQGNYGDLRFTLTVNVPSGTTSYLVDNLHFVGGASDAGFDAAEGGRDAADGGRDASPTDAADSSREASSTDAASGDSGATDASADAGPCGLCTSGTACAANGLCVSTDLTVWPNIQSQANSDVWLTQHHTTIRQMNPRVLAINFANTNHAYQKNAVNTLVEMTEVIATNTCQDPTTGLSVPCGVFDGLALGSRYHGYSNRGQPAFLNYSLAYPVDLSDQGTPPAGWSHNNSSKYPIKCAAGDDHQFDFGALLGSQFAPYFNIRDGRGALLTLAQAIAVGLVHEVFINVDGDNWIPGPTFGSCNTDADCSPANVCHANACYARDSYQCANGVTMADFQLPEVLEWKQNYTDPGATSNPSQPIVGSFNPAAGNGSFDADEEAALQALGRSIRFVYVNSQRGPGCAIHSLGHAFEHSQSSVPALGRDFTHFANFDLASKPATPNAAPFVSWYGLGQASTATSPQVITFLFPSGTTVSNSLSWGGVAGGLPTSGSMAKYNQGCGSVHYPPNARYGYDDANTQTVAATCESYGLHKSSGFDQQTPVNSAKWNAPTGNASASYDTVASDCQGGWQIYWRQSFPGYGNLATQSTSSGASNNVPIKNWWPYLYY